MMAALTTPVAIGVAGIEVICKAIVTLEEILEKLYGLSEEERIESIAKARAEVKAIGTAKESAEDRERKLVEERPTDK